jgi:hypothetical protein
MKEGAEKERERVSRIVTSQIGDALNSGDSSELFLIVQLIT